MLPLLEISPFLFHPSCIPGNTRFGERKSTIGWLQYIFLYYICEDDPDCVQIRPDDRKDYNKAVDILKKECKIGVRESLLDWESQATRKSQAAALNKLRKKLGYVVEYYD